MWARFINIMKYVWKNPIVQFACFTILEWAVVVFHKSTKNKFKKKTIEAITDACSQDYSVGTNEDAPEIEPEKKEATKEVVVEKPKRTRRETKKKVVEKVEETKPAKPKRVTRKKKTSESEDTKPVVKKPRVRKKKVETTEEKK